MNLHEAASIPRDRFHIVPWKGVNPVHHHLLIHVHLRKSNWRGKSPPKHLLCRFYPSSKAAHRHQKLCFGCVPKSALATIKTLKGLHTRHLSLVRWIISRHSQIQLFEDLQSTNLHVVMSQDRIEMTYGVYRIELGGS